MLQLKRPGDVRVKSLNRLLLHLLLIVMAPLTNYNFLQPRLKCQWLRDPTVQLLSQSNAYLLHCAEFSIGKNLQHIHTLINTELSQFIHVGNQHEKLILNIIIMPTWSFSHSGPSIHRHPKSQGRTIWRALILFYLPQGHLRRHLCSLVFKKQCTGGRSPCKRDLRAASQTRL